MLPSPLPPTHELLPGIRHQAATLILDFRQLPPKLPRYQNIQEFFLKCQAQGIDPRLPAQRQRFNDTFLRRSGKRYLIGRYGEDRIEMLRGSRIAAEGRTIHLGLDIFTTELAMLFAPCAGHVVATGNQAGSHTFGYYLIFQPDPAVLKTALFLGHLSRQLPPLGPVAAGDPLARLGDYRENENGGWSRHVHIQLLRELPPAGTQPKGYSTRAEMELNLEKYPDPSFLIQ